ncbi:hypothetical protein PTKIN_Ptkin03bG0225100 [Pterospermum kingtungense]
MVLLTTLQVKCTGNKVDSPFETHGLIMILFIVAMLSYALVAVVAIACESRFTNPSLVLVLNLICVAFGGEIHALIPLNQVKFWVQIYDLPTGYMSESIGPQIGDIIGRFSEYDINNNSAIWYAFMRIQGLVDSHKVITKEGNPSLNVAPTRAPKGANVVTCENFKLLNASTKSSDKELSGTDGSVSGEVDNGLVSKHFLSAVKTHKPDVIFLFETLSNSSKVENLRVRLGFEGALAVYCIGRSGGLCVLWRSSTDCSVVNFSQHHIDLEVKGCNSGMWQVTGFYGFSERNRRRESWDLLRYLNERSSLSWCLIGDFNDLLNAEDKRERVEHSNWLFWGIREVILEYDLNEIPIQGYLYTWEWGKGTDNTVEEKLDRSLVNSCWLELFPYSRLLNLIIPISNHSPILLYIEVLHVVKAPRGFRFENRWLYEQDLLDTVRGSWEHSEGLDVQLGWQRCSRDLLVCDKSINRRLRDEIKDCKRQISSLRERDDVDSINKVKELKLKLANL